MEQPLLSNKNKQMILGKKKKKKGVKVLMKNKETLG